jgi:hypothetical protein
MYLFQAMWSMPYPERPDVEVAQLRHRDFYFLIFYLLVFDQLQGVADP